MLNLTSRTRPEHSLTLAHSLAHQKGEIPFSYLTKVGTTQVQSMNVTTAATAALPAPTQIKLQIKPSEIELTEANLQCVTVKCIPIKLAKVSSAPWNASRRPMCVCVCVCVQMQITWNCVANDSCRRCPTAWQWELRVFFFSFVANREELIKDADLSFRWCKYSVRSVGRSTKRWF